MIVHFTQHTGQCQVWINQIAKDYGCTSRVISAQIKALMKAGLIEETRAWNHQTKEAGWYMASKRLVHGKSKTGAPTT